MASSLMIEPSINAVLWWRQLLSEVGTTACTGDQGVVGELARKRSGAVLNLFFSLSEQARCLFLYEVGAHNAESSIRFVKAQVGRTAVAFEASRSVFDRVTEQDLPKEIDYRHAAVGARPGSIKFFEPVDPKYSVWGSTLKRAGKLETVEYNLDMLTLDDDAKPRTFDGRSVAVWVDVEGSGYDVIAGAKNVIKNHVSLLYVEVNDLSTYEGSATSLNIIEDMLNMSFIPIARDNQYHDAYNILFAHSSLHSALRVAIAKWMYAYSGSSATHLAALNGGR